jgi:hypothetical protein
MANTILVEEILGLIFGSAGNGMVMVGVPPSFHWSD